MSMRWSALALAMALAACAGEGDETMMASGEGPPMKEAGMMADGAMMTGEGQGFARPAMPVVPEGRAPDPTLSALMGGSAEPGVRQLYAAPSVRVALPTGARPAPASLDHGPNHGAAPTAAPAASAGFGAQIASYRKQSAAESGWTTFSNQYGGLLSGTTKRIVRATIPGRGIFYRLVAQTADRSAAAALCDRILARGGDCLLRKL